MGERPGNFRPEGSHPSRPSEVSPFRLAEGDPRMTFIATRLKRRRNTLIQTLGSTEGEARFQTEIAFIGEMVGYLDIPPGRREINQSDFERELRRRAKEAGVGAAKVVSMGNKLYPDWVIEKFKAQQAEYRGGHHGADPHMQLDDGTHRRANPEND